MTMRNSMKQKQGSAIYNSNNQKMADSQLSSRNANAPSHSLFGASSSNNNNGGQILSELAMNNNLQRTGEMPHHCKVDRQNSFVLHNNNVKRAGTSAIFS